MEKPVNDKATEKPTKHCGGKSELIGGVMCEHAIGLYSNGLGSDTLIIHDIEDELVISADFSAFNYCPYCGGGIAECTMAKLQVTRNNVEAAVADNFGHQPVSIAFDELYEKLRVLEMAFQTVWPDEYKGYEARYY